VAPTRDLTAFVSQQTILADANASRSLWRAIAAPAARSRDTSGRAAGFFFCATWRSTITRAVPVCPAGEET
jgi:hypothetical protein